MKITLLATLVVITTLMWGVDASAGVITVGNASSLGSTYTLTTEPGAVPDATLAVALGLPAGALDALAAAHGSINVVEGSALYETVTVNIGDKISFKWQWYSNEHVFDGNPATFNDFGFVSLSTTGGQVIVDTYALDGTMGTKTIVVTAPGTLTYGVGVVDARDTNYTSTLIVTNLGVTPAAVPEPATLTLMGLGLAGVATTRARRKKRLRR